MCVPVMTSVELVGMCYMACATLGTSGSLVRCQRDETACQNARVVLALNW